MGRRDGFQFGSSLLVGLILPFIYVSVQAQQVPGFVSIDCGATSYSDALTKLPWEGDSPYTLTGTSGQVTFPVNSSLDNSEALKTFRYFPDSRSKHCYELPTTTGNISILLRATFYHGDAPELGRPIQFDVTVNGTIWFTVQYSMDDSYDMLTTPKVYEGIFFSPGNLTHFCLVSRQTGVPFISALELRQLEPAGGMYSINGDIGKYYLSNLWRLNCGAQIGSASVRYPDDPFDRLWVAPGPWASGLDSGTSTGVVQTFTDSVVNNVPPIVMQDAWLKSAANSSFWFYLPVNSSTASSTISAPAFYSLVSQVYVAVYFEEIESKSTAPGDVRKFTIDLDGVFANETAQNYEVMQPYYNWNVSKDSANFTFTALPSSTVGPIVNAVEIYAQFLFNDSTTAASDVDALALLQVSFNMTDWQGDPCCPVSWNWVGCTSDTPARVDSLMLSSMGIYASIPPSLSNLDALTEIHLDNNSLYGTIPDSLASLPNLKFLFLNNNNLSGEPPPALVTKLGTNFDYSGNALLGELSPSNSTTKKKSTNVGIIIAAIAGGVVGVGIVICLLLWYFCSKRQKRNHLKEETGISAKQPSSRPSPRRQVKPSSSDFDTSVNKPPLLLQPTEVGHVSCETVVIATNNFNEKIGEGSYGSVYHGWLDSREVAVKLNSIQSEQGHNEFITEVDILTRVHHRNLVSLIAYCDDGNQLILIYEYEVNGTLREWLCGGEKSRGTLDWKKRLEISADAAKGLEYLHKGCEPTIIHRDVKTNNILLDEKMTAKVADFGLSKSTTGDKTGGYSTGVKGTPGYLDPEYHHLGRLTYKSDVYSFGVVLAEIITGLPPFTMQNETTQIVLVDRVRKLVERNDMEALADPNLQGQFNSESMWRMADIALACLDPIGVMRPDFTQVVSGIMEAIELEKTTTLHSPLAPSSRSFILRSNSSHSYQNLP